MDKKTAGLKICPKTGKIISVNGKKINKKIPVWILLVIGFFSLIWILIRVFPKPSRITYPCIQAGAPLAMFFLSWCAGIFSTVFIFKNKSKNMLFKYLYTSVALTLTLGLTIGLAGSTVSPANSIKLNLSEKIQQNNVSDIFVVNGTTGYDDGFSKLVSLMNSKNIFFYNTSETPNGMISNNDVIIIKVNAQWDQRGGTNVDLVKSVISKILSHPSGFTGEIVIADNGQNQYGAKGYGGSLSWEENNGKDASLSMSEMIQTFNKKYKISAYLWDNITNIKVKDYMEGDLKDGYIVSPVPDQETGIYVSYPKFKSANGTYISFKNGIWDSKDKSFDSDRLKVINIPVLKTHSMYGVTGAVKHYMGVTSDRLTKHNSHNTIGNGGMGTMFVETRFPVLNIIDAIYINAQPSRGPLTKYTSATETNIIAASTDPVALDYWAAKNILMQAASKSGFNNLNTMNPDYKAYGSFGIWLELSMKELINKGYKTTNNPNKINVYIINY